MCQLADDPVTVAIESSTLVVSIVNIYIFQLWVVYFQFKLPKKGVVPKSLSHCNVDKGFKVFAACATQKVLTQLELSL